MLLVPGRGWGGQQWPRLRAPRSTACAVAFFREGACALAKRRETTPTSPAFASEDSRAPADGPQERAPCRAWSRPGPQSPGLKNVCACWGSSGSVCAPGRTAVSFCGPGATHVLFQAEEGAYPQAALRAGRTRGAHLALSESLSSFGFSDAVSSGFSRTLEDLVFFLFSALVTAESARPLPRGLALEDLGCSHGFTTLYLWSPLLP